MLAFIAMCGNEIGAVGRAVNRDLALLATANGANPFGLGGAKPLSLALFTDRTGHERSSTEEDRSAEYAAQRQKTKIGGRPLLGSTSLLREPPVARLRTITYHASRKRAPQNPRVVHRRGRLLFYSRPRRLSVLGNRHPLAALLSGVDVRGHHRNEPSREPLGILHRHFCGRPLGLCQYCRDDLLLQRHA